MTSNDKTLKSFSLFTSCLVALLALASFSLSFESLRKLAVEQGVVSPSLGWIFPLIVDGAIVVFSLSALRASLKKEKTLWLRCLVIFSTCGSILFNMAHVELKPLALMLAATPPLLLFLSFEAFIHSIQSEMKNVIQKKQNKGVPSPEARITIPKPKVKASITSDKKATRLEKVQILKNQGLTPSQIVEQLKHVSLRTVQRDLAELENNKKEE